MHIPENRLDEREVVLPEERIIVDELSDSLQTRFFISELGPDIAF
jgi:hypothetical protein